MDWINGLDNGLTGRGILFVVSSVSGGGKTTIISRLLERLEGLRLVVSHTTRKPRKGEQDGREYHFISASRFRQMVDQGDFLEWAEVYGHCYGTSRQSVERVLSGNRDAILDIDVQGSLQVKRKRPDAILVFIVPPSLEEQERRLRRRGTESDHELMNRLRAAREELALLPEYHYAVKNDEVLACVRTVQSIIIAQRCRLVRPAGQGREGDQAQ